VALARFDADAYQTLFLLVESDPKSGGRRYLALGKLRFEPRWTELEVQSRTATVQALDEFGDTQELTLRWGVPIPPTVSRESGEEPRAKEVQAQAGKKPQRMADDMALADRRA
jgi:hypothetical protein